MVNLFFPLCKAGTTLQKGSSYRGAKCQLISQGDHVIHLSFLRCQVNETDPYLV